MRSQMERFGLKDVKLSIVQGTKESQHKRTEVDAERSGRQTGRQKCTVVGQ